MLTEWGVLTVALAYVLGPFGIAYYVDRRARAGQKMIDSPIICSLSLAVYATSWTFYGSVGRAAASGIGFLPIYLGPTMMALLWWYVLRRTVRIAKTNSITSIADFTGSRYGQSALLGGAVAVIAVVVGSLFLPETSKTRIWDEVDDIDVVETGRVPQPA